MRSLLALGLIILFGYASAREGDCEVCNAAVKEIAEKVGKDKSDVLKIEERIDAFCAKPSSDKYEKFCYYIMGVKRQAVAQPIMNGVPPEKICDRLKKKSAEICALRFGAGGNVGAPDTATIDDYNKLRVNQLKSIMAEKGIKCDGCIEKADFVRKLESVLGKPTPKKEL